MRVRQCGPQVLGGPLRPLRHPSWRLPVVHQPGGPHVRKGVVPDRDQAADAVSGTLDELPARCRRCDPSPIANCTAARQTAVDLHVEVRSVCRCLSSLVGLRRPGDGLGCRYPEHRELGKHSWAARRRAAVLGALGRITGPAGPRFVRGDQLPRWQASTRGAAGDAAQAPVRGEHSTLVVSQRPRSGRCLPTGTGWRGG
jgi:hypothetical protein